jgi:hypothetical protein
VAFEVGVGARVCEVPVRPDLGPVAGAELDGGTGRHTVDALEHRPRAHQSGQSEHLVQADEVDAARHRGVLQHGLDLGAEDQLAALVSVEQRRDTEVVAGADEELLAVVVEHDRELPVETADEVAAELLVEVRDHLGVAARAQGVAPVDEEVTQFAVVVDLAGGHGDDLPALVVHRLVAGPEVVDRQPGERERHGFVDVETGGVRSPVSDRRAHGVERLARRPGVVSWPDEARESTHRQHPFEIDVLVPSYAKVSPGTAGWPPGETEAAYITS